ncbi:hypothetical protein [Ramlibacter sp. PS4R-6]|uniref:hypothetical protein n=1 Tax=Ramlibacter sp. PS4R-6 TaxID=3133438 RepID=UPI0030AC4873
MLKKSLLSLSLLAVAFAAQAQTSPAKKELAARILKSQQPAIEAMARGLVERPALEIMGGAMQVIGQRVPKERQEAVAREVQGDAQKYAQETVPMAQQRAVAIAPTTIGALLEERFTEDELRQIASALENPALIKFQNNLPEMQNALGEKLVADTRSAIEPKVQALEASVGKRLGLPAQGAAPAPAAKPPAKKQ